jgi:hypothetical protein
MKSKASLVLFLLMLTGCKVHMDDCYRSIYEYFGPEGADTFVMEVTQDGVIEDLLSDDLGTIAWVKTEAEMWAEVELPPDTEFEVGDRVVVSFLVKFQERGQLDIIEKRIE